MTKCDNCKHLQTDKYPMRCAVNDREFENGFQMPEEKEKCGFEQK